MLHILGRGMKPCDGVTRREALTVGGLSLLGGMTLPRFLAAREAQPTVRPGKAKSVVLLNLFGGPPHIDTFDMKPAAPDQVRGEFKPIDTVLPGLRICEHLPLTARVMDRA